MDQTFRKTYLLFIRKSTKDLAFFLALTTEINKFKKAKNKVKIALHLLSQKKEMQNTILEFFLFDMNDHLRNVIMTNLPSPLKQRYGGLRLRPSTELKKAFKENKVIAMTDFSKESLSRGNFIRKTKIKKSIFFPIKDLGLFVINKLKEKKFTKKEIDLIKIFVRDILKPSLELSLDNERNIELAIKDGLTGLYNKTYGKGQMERLFASSERYKNSLSLIVIDMDDFKKYNDTHGHLAGDDLLKTFAKLLQDETRKSDIVFRYGGEEFVILAPNTTAQNAKKLAEKIQDSLQDYSFPLAITQPLGKISVSIGIASFPLHAKNLKDLLYYADKAMYKAKKQGKDQVQIFKKK